MISFIIRRTLWTIPTLIAVSIVSFVIMDLPPGDYLTSYVARLAAQGDQINQQAVANLRERYGLDQPIYIRYFKWISGVLRGDFGRSFEYNQPVEQLIFGRLQLTLILALSTLGFTWVVAIPVGIYSAMRKYSIGDYLATFLSFLGLSIPNFLLALVFMYWSFRYFNISIGGLFSSEYIGASWSGERVVDLLKHLWIPVLILGSHGIASLVRIMRANLLDELYKPYVTTARSKGLPEWLVVTRYPVRVALNPFVSTIGWSLPQIISGAVITAVVLNLPTTGPMLLQSLLTQDMFLAGAFILLLSCLTIIGTLVSDILLAWLDPRIRYG